MGAASLSLARVGWSFETPFTLRDQKGEIFALTSVSPALLAYHLQGDWKKAVEVQAGKAIGLEGHQVDTSKYKAVMASVEVPARDKALLKAFACHAVWSNQRLHDVGYAVSTECPLCGGPSDSLGHRLFACPGTQALRDEHLSAHDLDFIRYSAAVRALATGLQLMPPPVGERPRGVGHEQWESWTLTGAPLEDVLIGDVYTDGSCVKDGPPPGTERGGRWSRLVRTGSYSAGRGARWGRSSLRAPLPPSTSRPSPWLP